MPQNGCRFVKIYIKKYGSLPELSLDLSEGVNEISAISRERAESVASFVADLFYGRAPAEGYVELALGDKSVKIAAEGDLRCVEPSDALDGSESIGEAVFGIGEDVFRELYCVRVSQGEAAPVSPDLLDACLKKFGAPQGLFKAIDAIDGQKKIYTNENGDGKSDLAIKEHRELEEKCAQVDLILSKKQEISREMENYDARLDENAKRCVILKADMRRFTDDIRLIENRQNASQLKNEIAANEKKLRITKYEASRQIPLPQPGELSDIKRIYADFSRIKAQLSDSANQLMSARENLEYHKKIFDHEDFDADSVLRQYDIINSNRRWRLALLGLSVALMLAAVIVFIALAVSPSGSMLYATLVGLSVFIAGLISFVASDIFSKKTEMILERLKIRTKKEFDDLHEKLNAHKKTQVLYEEQTERCEKQCDVFSRLSDDYLAKLRKLLSYTGLPAETSQEVSSLCDRLISNCDAIAELEEQIAAQKQTYQRMLSANVNKKELEVSPEYSALERELDFVNRQNASLLAKKEASQKKLEELDGEMAKIDEYRAGLEECERRIGELSREYNAVCASQNPLLRQAEEIREKLDDAICPTADRLLANVRKPGEHFSLTRRMTPVITDENGQEAPGNGYLNRLAALVYRIMLSMLHLEKAPLFFVDAFSFCDKKTAEEIVSRLKDTGHQIIVLNFPGSVPLRELLG